MNVHRVNAAAGAILASMQRGRTIPAALAYDLEARGLLQSPESAAELDRLRALLNAVPAELSEAQVDALAEAGNRALNDHYHEDLCHCSDWPGSCASSGNYLAGSWDTAAFDIGMRAVIGLWESMRAAASSTALDGERLALIRKSRSHCEAVRFETEDERPVHVWGPSDYPGREMCQRCTTERVWAEDADADEVVLLAEVDRLRARVAELEAERHSTNEALSDAAEALRANRDQIAELEAAAEQVAGQPKYRDRFGDLWEERAEGTELQLVQLFGANREVDNGWRESAEAARRDFGPMEEIPVSASVAKLRSLLAPPLEDPHDSPLHHTYRLGHDLPEAPHA
ncbi:hypothetical protein [Streptomyces goshikiensis]|uniref:hypothetical protein n=1 Tax=Streptomyces goshikiensis TaxID=1942 RepID=UPI00369C2632